MNPMDSNNIQAQAAQHAGVLFEQSWRTGWYKGLLARLRGKNRELLYLGDVDAKQATVSQTLERVSIRLEAIRGTQGRGEDFDCDFHPRHRRFKQRWISVCMGMMQRLNTMPPIETVRIDQTYYVIDGHHRVSVARALGYIFIDGNVHVWALNHQVEGE